MNSSGSVSGFESDAGDVAAVDWTLPREEAEEEQQQQAAPTPAAPTAARATGDGGTATATTSSDWLEQAGSSSDEEEEEYDDEDEDDEDEDEYEDGEDDEEEEAAGTSEEADAETADASNDNDDDRPPTPTHARLLRLAYTVGSRVASAAAAAATGGGGAAAAEAPETAQQEQPEAPPPPQQQQQQQPPRRPLQCAITPLPVPPKPPHPPLLQRLNAAVAGDVAPRGNGGGIGAVGGSGSLGAPLSACRRALARAGAGGGGGGGWGSSDDEEEDEDSDMQEEEEEGDAATTTPQRRSARLAAAARGEGGEGDGGGDAAGARDQRDGSGARAAAPHNNNKRPSPSSPSTSPSSTLTVLNTARLLLKRDLGLGAGTGGSLSRAQRLHAAALPPSRALPTVPCRVRDQMASRAYVGQFSADGALFVAAFQDRRVRLYDVGAPSGGVDASASASSGGGGDGGGGERVRTNSGNSNGNTNDDQTSTPPQSRFFTRWRLRKDVSTRLTRWTVTDTALSPDGRYLVYSSITPIVWLVDVGGAYDPQNVSSRANETQVHDALSFAGPPPPPHGNGDDSDDDGRFHHHHHRNFGVWSVAWAPGAAGELVAGTSDRSALVYDMGAGRPIARMGGHGDDVNAVAHLDPLSPHLVVTGSDDALVRLWDRRVGGGGGGNGGVASARRAAAAGEGGGGGGGGGGGNANANPQQQHLSQTSTPVGVWIGHTEGVTHLSPRGDGRLLLSNAKDQTARAWDSRSGLRPPSEARSLPPVRGARGSGFDYRWEAYPYRGHDVAHPHDASVQVYRGHSVLQSLIRAYWSPEESTGGRYVYAGSADGAAVIWDAATAEVVARLSGAHGAVVRDVAWHPREPAIVTSSWDGRLIEWRAPGGG